LFDQFPNLTPEQKNTRSGLTSLTVTGIAIFKGIQRIFSTGSGKDRKYGFPSWGKIAGIAGITLGSQVFLGENPISLFGKLMNGGLSIEEFGNRLKNSTTFRGGENDPAYQEYQGQMSLMELFGQMTPKEVSTQMTARKSRPNEWSAFYNPLLEAYPNNPALKALGPKYDEAKFIAWLNYIGVGYPIYAGVEDTKLVDIAQNPIAVNSEKIQKL
jgi:hypothetical protein